MFIETALAAEAAAPSGLQALGLDWAALLFQLINFGALLVILRFVAYKPILRVLDMRRLKIEESLKASAEMERLRQDLAAEQRQKLADISVEADRLLAQSKSRADALINEAKAQAKTQAEHVVAQAEQRAAQEFEEHEERLKRQVVEWVALATERLIHEKVDTDTDEALIRQALTEARKQKGAA